MTEQTQAVHFVENDSVLKTYKLEYSDYYLGKYERLGDYSTSNVKAKAKVLLIFLQKVTNEYQVIIPPAFYAPDTPIFSKPRAYDELEYRLHNTELMMEFYLWVVKSFCHPGSHIFSVFTGRKLTCATLVIAGPYPSLYFSSTRANMHFHVRILDRFELN
jgi:hypothetical protein